MTCQGAVKSFNGGKGFGFIDLAGEDVFIHIKDCSDGGVPQTGDLMSFEIEDNPAKPGAKKAKGATGGTGKLEAMGKGGGKGAQGTGACTGVVKSFSQMKAWGFLSYEGQDVFFHVKDMQDGSTAQNGDTLRFDLIDNPQKPGSMKAMNVTGGTGWPEAKGFDKGKGKGKDAWGGGGKGWGGDAGWSPYGGGKGWGGDAGWGGDGGKGWGGDAGWGGKGGGWGMEGGWGGGKGKW